MKKWLIGLSVVTAGIVGGLFYFADKAEKNVPSVGEIRVEAQNVGGR
ncbi:MAG: hypothetical protein AAF719_13565 [Pseudomonadota bacterium]